MDDTAREFDYLVVGGGSGGCTVAARLSEDPGVTVCLLEAGGRDDDFRIHMPAGFVGLREGCAQNWSFRTVPQEGLGGREGFQPRGRTLGGSSSINAMIYIRGHRGDYDRWAREGAHGWSYADVLPYFKRAEDFEPAGGRETAHHGAGGPLTVSALRSPSPMNDRLFEAGRQMQIAINDDFNGERQEGLGLYHVTMRDGQRCSAARAYLRPALDRPNLHVVTAAHARRVLFEEGRAAGVEAEVDGVRRTYRARGEVVLAAGAFQTPQLLMLSGVGPATHLAEHGIEARVDRAEVGRNLQDHIDHTLLYKARTREPMGLSLLGMPATLREVVRYLTKREGQLTSNVAESGGFLRTRPGLDQPDVQLHFIPALVDDHGRKLHWGHGFTCHVCVLRPVSRGTVTLGSRDPAAPPVIDPCFLSEEEDAQTLLRGVKLTQRIMKAPAFDEVRGEPLYASGAHDDEALMADIRARADTVYHPVGTCRMGSDAGAVVDPALRVRGVAGLRIADASVMPSLVSGNTNAPTIMIGERAADFLKEARRGAERTAA
jgi:choline dehydrogenase-like flavoprotein